MSEYMNTQAEISRSAQGQLGREIPNLAQAGAFGTQYMPEQLAQFRDEQMKREREYRMEATRKWAITELLRAPADGRVGTVEEMITDAEKIVAFVMG